jgi:transcriptional regulator with XRE-family HTH domain
MNPAKTTKRGKGFDELRKQVDADPARRARVEEHKAAMLGELRRKLDLTQVIVAERLDVTQENISAIERGQADVRLSTLSRYVEALGGRLEIRAAFPEETVALSVRAASAKHSRRSRGRPAATKRPRNSKPKKARDTAAANDA